MIRLEKFYDLISRNATVTLTNRQLDTTFFEGSMRDIPDRFSNCIVEDFCVSNTGDFLFKIAIARVFEMLFRVLNRHALEDRVDCQ